MSYEKPELLVLSVAASAVRGATDASGSSTHDTGIKSAVTKESGKVNDGSNGTADFGVSSSSSAASYESDE